MSRKYSLVDALFLPTTQRVLAATVLQPRREWYLSDLAAHLRVTPSSLQRPLAKLVSGGILTRRQEGNRVYYKADQDCPILPELSGILTKTVGVAGALRDALESLAEQIQIAFIHGSIAQERERSESDIDLIVIGNAPSADIAMALRPLHEQLGREVNITRYLPKELAAKMQRGDHFLSTVMQKPKIFLIGDEHDLGKIIGGKSRGTRAHQQTGAG
jgi:DNA-binding transcriptional ArsR family regulator